MTNNTSLREQILLRIIAMHYGKRNIKHLRTSIFGKTFLEIPHCGNKSYYNKLQCIVGSEITIICKHLFWKDFCGKTFGNTAPRKRALLQIIAMHCGNRNFLRREIFLCTAIFNYNQSFNYVFLFPL